MTDEKKAEFSPRDFWITLWSKIHPLAEHTAILVLVLIGVLVIGLILRGLKWCFGEEAKTFCELVEEGDQYLALLALSCYAVVFVVDLTAIVGGIVWEGWPGKLLRWLWERFRGGGK